MNIARLPIARRLTTCRTGVLLVFALLILTACQHSDKKIIAVIPKATSHLFFVSVHTGVTAAAKDFGVNVVWDGPDQETNYSRQIEIVDAMIARHVNAIAISATDRDALVAPVQRAIRAGIPVSVFDSGLAIDDYVTFVATDNYGAGQTAARTLAELIGGKGTIAAIMQRPGGQSTTVREKGFTDAIAKEFPRIHIAQSEFGMGDPAISRTTAENILTAHPHLDGIFASAEASSIGAIQAIKARGLAGKIKLVGFDFSDAHRDALEQGIMNATIVQNTYGIGYEAVKSLAMKLKGETPQKRIDLPGRVVRKQDLSLPDLQKLLAPAIKGS